MRKKESNKRPTPVRVAHRLEGVVKNLGTKKVKKQPKVRFLKSNLYRDSSIIEDFS